MVEHIVHIDGAPKPKRPQCGMKQGGGVLSKGASQAAAQRGDHCEVDRATGAALESSIRPSAVGEADRQTLGLLPCETTGSSPVATTRAEPIRKVRLVAYSFS